MTDPSAVPPDDPQRQLTVAQPDDPALPHLGVVGDTYTILLTGDDTAGRYTLIDMHVPAGRRSPAAPARLRGDVQRARGRSGAHLPRRDT